MGHGVRRLTGTLTGLQRALSPSRRGRGSCRCPRVLQWLRMRSNGKSFFGRCAVLLLAGAACLPLPLRAQAADAGAMSATKIPQAALIQPAELDQQLQANAHPAPLILQVGSRLLFDEAHIPGAAYAGPGATAQGLDSLRNMLANRPRSHPIVIYCGCCPWTRCPNIGPAWRLLHQMGFINLKVLYIADNFGSDWVAKGYRVEKSQ